MKIEIWSDIMCPFCYIGKRKFEVALAQLDNIDNIEIEWKSFLLSPEMKTDDTKNIHQFLAEHKGISLEEATGMNDNVAHIAANVGLTYNFDKTIPANSFNAHRLLHFAKQHGRQQAAEEALFAAYFTEGKNIDDAQTLVHIAAQLGLDGGAFADAMGSGAFVNDVLNDINEAQQLGIRGVPFFVFDRKYAVSGAQDPAVFLETLEKVLE
ncbi:DsbA family oxidoreductase [Flavobacterium subsaxonicum]|uniref:DSBA oxidoreductase n=1 Tax=Flavobacterium subsaxonicum WB 4.1-42 = DSM 21790 TaxID=1121898 RepID=A0A0A2MH43_9FLAO|nr:DsbA family oxidoreductase [Flavobacterium subsaxonicum]KGO91594.1 DSBA oxidoreductase [Flavobacterium subsaxonicum WB 4.1-42 = DSM 21790]